MSMVEIFSLKANSYSRQLFLLLLLRLTRNCLHRIQSSICEGTEYARRDTSQPASSSTPCKGMDVVISRDWAAGRNSLVWLT